MFHYVNLTCNFLIQKLPLIYVLSSFKPSLCYLLIELREILQWGDTNFGTLKNSDGISLCSKGEKKII